MSEDTKRAMIAGAFGIAGTLIPIFISWTRERDAVSQRSKQLDEAIRRVQFWDQWLKLSSVIGDTEGEAARLRVQHELEMLCQLLSGASAQIHTEQAALKTFTNAFQAKLRSISGFRRFLLLYKPARAVAWIPRIFFFFFIFVILVGSTQPPYNKDTVAGVGGLLFLAVIFWFLSRSIEKPRKETLEVHAVPPPTPPIVGDVV